MRRMFFLRMSFFLISAAFIGGQLTHSMPERNIPYSFEYYDSNENGTLEEDEMSFLFLNKMDVNGDGFLIEDEWTISVASIYLLTMKNHLREFHYWDGDRDAQIGIAEIQNLLQETDIFSLWDVDKDKKINGDELPMLLQDLFIDRDKGDIDYPQSEIFLR